ncbi:hypothetical protein BRCON_1992 [Candidatus Sumerlaea chitinivorans]|jgi:hypothetical protein|uniref:DUF3137 domain-containing protein n=1 Tax=Sumerlaea chitinivorans TaxID=2250252 RepID=A0A2Z4Y748_SUMC1|nr:hypothetical protein BRCON_1992 [Candidatus Sumerlaea chitinivorans]
MKKVIFGIMTGLTLGGVALQFHYSAKPSGSPSGYVFHPFHLFLAFLALAILAAIVSWQLEEKRRRALREFALKHGLTFRREHNTKIREEFPWISELHRGENRYAYNILTGEWESHPVLAFDYHYQITTHSKNGSHTTHYNFTVVTMDVGFPVSDLLIRREGLFDKLVQAVGFEDIDFESAEFSRKFLVKSKDRKWAYDIIHVRLMEFLLETDPKFAIQMGGTSVAIYNARKRVAPEEYADHFEFCRKFVEFIPAYVREQRLSEASARSPEQAMPNREASSLQA